MQPRPSPTTPARPRGRRSTRAAALALGVATIGAAALVAAPAAHAAGTVPVTVTITHVDCADDCDETGLEAALEDEADFYAKVFVDGAETVTPRAPDDEASIDPDWTVSAAVPDTSTTVPVTIQIWDHDSTSGDDLGDASPVAGKNNLDLVVDLASGDWSGDVAVNAACTTGAGGTEPRVRVCFSISTLSTSGDADGDGLMDGWERQGYDGDGDGSVLGSADVDLPGLGADPSHQDLFLELDHEPGMTLGVPSLAEGLRSVRQAFAVAPRPNPLGGNGIRLHVDTDLVDPQAHEGPQPATCTNGLDDDGDGQSDWSDPACAYVGFSDERPATCANGLDDDTDGLADGADPDCRVGDLSRNGTTLGGPVGACQVSDGQFRTAVESPTGLIAARRFLFHYGIMATFPAAPAVATDAPCVQRDASGAVTNLSGGDGVLGGGTFVEFNHDAGTIMHELGHNLNLDHGGTDAANCKPNHLSVMSYSDQFGIPRVGGGGVLDYSPPRIALDGSTRAAAPLPAIVENALDDATILDATDAVNMLTFLNGATPAAVVTSRVDQGVNWAGDTDPPLESGQTFDVDSIAGITDCTTNNGSTSATLNGSNDWAAVALTLRPGVFGPSLYGTAGAGADHDRTPTLAELFDLRRERNRTDLAVAGTVAPNPVAAGTQYTATVTVTDRGPNPATATELVVDLAPQVTFVSASAPCAPTGPSSVRCALGHLDAGTSATVTVTTAVPADLVHLHGSPLVVSHTARVRNLSGEELAPADNSAAVDDQAVAVADLSVSGTQVPNPPTKLPVGQWFPISVTSVLSSGGPSSPMDVDLVTTAVATPGASVSPTNVTTFQRALLLGEQRPVDTHLLVRCDRPGTHRIDIGQRVRPDRSPDTDPNPRNDTAATAFVFTCLQDGDVIVNVQPGRFPNVVRPDDAEVRVGIMTTAAGEYGRAAAFDAGDVEPTSLRLGRRTDVVAGGGVAAVAPSVRPRDVPEPDGVEQAVDGDADLSAVFEVRAPALPGDGEVCVAGTYLDHATGTAQPFVGCDSIVIEA